jgi:2-polyprenyl-3-methyl-5-hydroxy-6-metoxy-1,4-benzoquinol methylase
MSGGQELVERTVVGLHEALLGRFIGNVSAESSILDLGCGTGAWLDRLRQLGFKRLEGVDEDVMKLRIPQITFHRANLDYGDWGVEGTKYTLVTAIEVIEHIENPGRFLRKTADLLLDEGHLLITTPNLHSVGARLRFLVRGRLRHFDEYGDPTHIYPVFIENIQKLVDRCGLRILETWGYPSDGSLIGSRPIVNVMCSCLKRLFSEEVPGDVLCLLIGKKGVPSTSPR